MDTDKSVYSPAAYRRLCKEDFDAMVTGELVHQALYLEADLVGIISDHFAIEERSSDFVRLLLRRDGLGFQDKIEVVRGMVPLFPNREKALELKSLLTKVEAFKSLRNAFAHGHDEIRAHEAGDGVTVSLIGRSGIEKLIIVTPESHCSAMESADRLHQALDSIRQSLQVATA